MAADHRIGGTSDNPNPIPSEGNCHFYYHRVKRRHESSSTDSIPNYTNMMALAQPNNEFAVSPSVAKFSVPMEQLLTTLNATLETALQGIATGAIVFSQHHEPQPPRVLLVQRSATDSMPNRWEVPGGAVDAGETVLAGAVREVREESGLVVKSIPGLLAHAETAGKGDGIDGGYLIRTTRGRRIVKFTFVVEVDDSSAVKLDPVEHQDYVWASEEECRAKKVARIGQDGRRDVDLQYTTPAQEAAILKAFSERRGGQ